MALQIGQIFVYVSGYLVIAISLVPLVRHDNWIFRIFEYPRGQKLLINLALLALFIAIAPWEMTHAKIFVGLLGCNSLYLGYQVFPYTKLASYQMKAQVSRDEQKEFSLLISNVYQDNRDYARCLQAIDHCNPDIIILVETDARWKAALVSLNDAYPYQILKPLENTYGMLLYSKLELVNPQVKFLIDDHIPSMHTQIRLRSGDLFFLYSLHPQPPVPQENPRSTERDAEILTIAKEAKACTLPAIVAGDLNDVAWSYTTELFLKVSGLLDPRRGRGFFNTFHAHHWFLRWPLDHIFCSRHFQLIRLKRLSDIGSDHFPIFVKLGLHENDTSENKQQELKANKAEKEMTDEKIANGK